MKDTLKRNVVNPKYRRVIWSAFFCLTTLTWIPTLKTLFNTSNEVQFQHFDQETATTCVLLKTGLSSNWSCQQMNSFPLEDYDPTKKIWVYETEDGAVVVSRETVKEGVLVFTIEHPRIKEKKSTTLNMR